MNESNCNHARDVCGKTCSHIVVFGDDLKSIINAEKKIIKIKMNYEVKRCESFYGWPLQTPTPIILAKNGFYYKGKGDHVKCNFCELQLFDWKICDDLNEHHSKYSPNCPMVKNSPCQNIQIIETIKENNKDFKKDTFCDCWTKFNKLNPFK